MRKNILRTGLFLALALCTAWLSPRAEAVDYASDAAPCYYNAAEHVYCSDEALTAPITLQSGDTLALASADDMEDLADYVNHGGPTAGVTYTLIQDVSMDDVTLCIGTAASPFKGIFDGCGHTVSGYYISLAGDCAGLFGYTDGATVKDLTVSFDSVAFSLYSSHSNIGGIVGSAKNTSFSGCVNTGDISAYSLIGSYSNIGGIVGSADGCTIADCVNSGAVAGTSKVGGIAGQMDCGAMEWCSNSGKISASSKAGGLIGSFSGKDSISQIGTLQYCWNTGSVTASSGAAGGLVGISSTTNTSIFGCYNQGSVSGKNAGGISGGNGDVSYCYNASAVSGTSAAHPIMAGGDPSDYIYCFYDSDLLPGSFGSSNCCACTTEQLKSGKVFDTREETTFCTYWVYEAGKYPTLSKTASVPPSGDTGTSPSQPVDDFVITDIDTIIYSGAPVTASTDLRGSIQFRYTGEKTGAVSAAFLDGSGNECIPVNAGEYTLKLTIGTFSKEYPFNIAQRAITAADFLNTDVLTETEYYDGSPVIKDLHLSEQASLLAEGADFTVSYDNNSGPTAAGKSATVTVTGKGSCTGSFSFEFAIAIDPAKGDFTPNEGGCYTVGRAGERLAVRGDSTVYSGGIQVYLVPDTTYAFRCVK